jgi:endoglucanase
MKPIRIFLSIVGLLIFQNSDAQENRGELVRLNQIGFYPDGQKLAVVLTESATEFYIVSSSDSRKVFSGKLSDVKQSTYSPRKTKIADFSKISDVGNYFLVVPQVGSSYEFSIKERIHESIVKASLKAFYFQRFSLPLTRQFAGQWARASSGSHNDILVHPSAASEKRPAGSVIASPRGWIDAGDYNKYVVNSGITTSTLLSAYEDFSSYYDSLNLNIPESKNALPDILDEALWNLRWMLTMQDPNDGGVYHKCTNAKFDGMVMPDKAISPRYVVQKGTAAALNLAAVAAQAARIFQRFNKQVPGLSDSCLSAAKKAWAWAKQNPTVEYDQNKMNKSFDPDVSTGGYGDNKFDDEFLWATAELAVSTKDPAYFKAINLPPVTNEQIPSWNQVALLGYYALTRVNDKSQAELVNEVKKRIVAKANALIEKVEQQTYHTPMGTSVKDFVWGSNAVAANQGILLLRAFEITKDKKYFNHALSNLDYILGRNATGYSFVTGYGDKTPMHIHHRPSEADGIDEPVPGLLAGGPNPGMQDKCHYNSSVPDEAYVDDVCSYASNEVAINWNAPLVYLSGAIEALQEKSRD